jgi:hypothetical protein
MKKWCNKEVMVFNFYNEVLKFSGSDSLCFNDHDSRFMSLRIDSVIFPQQSALEALV